MNSFLQKLALVQKRLNGNLTFLRRIKMNRQMFFTGAVVVIVCVAGLLLWRTTVRKKNSFSIASPAFSSRVLESKYTCDGANLNPPLTLSNLPQGAKSYAIVMEELDSKGKVSNPRKINWIMWNVPTDTANTTITEGIRPAGTIGRSFVGNFAYAGPCPDKGQQKQYMVHAYVLNSEQLSINSAASVEDFDSAIAGKVIGEEILRTSYKRAN
jgi:Raf kinase inhibitor-like YbhB/YbcL family protein